MTRTYDRSTEDVGNLVLLEHVNVTQADQAPTTLFWVLAMGGTRDPYLMVELDNMWVNFGRTQVHLPTRPPAQVLRGTIGFVVPSLDELRARFERVAPRLAGTRFAWRESGGVIEATCPWGNRVRCHPPAPEFGDRVQLGLAYVAFDVPPDAAAGIARFYTSIIGSPGRLTTRGGAPAAHVPVGRGQALWFVETDAATPAYDGHHVQVYLADFSGPYRRLLERGLITLETDAHEWRFQTIVDPEDGRMLFEVEHEVRSLRHPLYARPMVNRNPAIRNSSYVPGMDAFRGTY